MKVTHIKGSALFQCLLRLPKKYLPQKNYPLVMGLHGGGGKAEDFITLWDDFQGINFIYAVPQAPYPILFNSEIRYDWALWPSRDEELISRATRLSEENIVVSIQNLTNQFNIDKVYLMGFSQGAIFSYLVGIKQHHLLDGLICLSGPGLLEPLINPFTGSFDPDWLSEDFIQDACELRIFIVHGKDDQEAEYKLGMRSRDVLVKHGYDVTFRDFDGGHSLPPEKVLAHIVKWIK